MFIKPDLSDQFDLLLTRFVRIFRQLFNPDNFIINSVSLPS